MLFLYSRPWLGGEGAEHPSLPPVLREMKDEPGGDRDGFLPSLLPAGWGEMCRKSCVGQGYFPLTERLWVGIKASLSQGMRLGQTSGQSLALGWGRQRVQGEASTCHLVWGNAELALTARRRAASRTWSKRAKEMSEPWKGGEVEHGRQKPAKGQRGKERAAGKR